MKIVHVTECLAGGVLTFLQNFTQALSEDQHILIYSDRPNTPKDVRACFGENVELVYWPHAHREIRPVEDLRALLALVGLLRRYQEAEVVQLHSSKAGFLGRVACRLLGFPKVFYIPHGVAFAREDISTKKKRFYVTLEKLANLFSGDFIACSASEKALMERNGISNAHVISNGVAPGPRPVLRAPQNPLVVGTVGRLTYQKHPRLFDAIAASFEGDTRVRFVWIGDGELRTDIHERDNTVVTGWLSLAEVQVQLADMDVYLSTALWEGLPYAVLEAMNAGKPLLLSDCVGNVDLVDGKNGSTYHSVEEAHERIEAILAHPEVLRAQGEHSYQLLAERFSLAYMKEQYRALYLAPVQK